MTDHDDNWSRRYRELAQEEPPASLDARILARARRHAPGKRRHWMIPVSIAAVLMLGVGVSLRMQMEQPGVETSASRSELSMRDSAGATPAAAPPPAAPVEAKPLEAPALPRTPAPKLESKAKVQLAAPAPPATPAKRASKPFPAPMQERADASREESAVIATPNAYATVTPPTARFAPSPPPTMDTATRNVAPAALAAPSPAASGAATGTVMNLQATAPQRAKQEAEADAFKAKELKKSAALPERDVELERIAKLREAGKNTEADKALEDFRKRYPDFRIPEAMWERVRPR